jgi:hypothetical protein
MGGLWLKDKMPSVPDDAKPYAFNWLASLTESRTQNELML